MHRAVQLQLIALLCALPLICGNLILRSPPDTGPPGPGPRPPENTPDWAAAFNTDGTNSWDTTNTPPPGTPNWGELCTGDCDTCAEHGANAGQVGTWGCSFDPLGDVYYDDTAEVARAVPGNGEVWFYDTIGGVPSTDIWIKFDAWIDHNFGFPESWFRMLGPGGTARNQQAWIGESGLGVVGIRCVPGGTDGVEYETYPGSPMGDETWHTIKIHFTASGGTTTGQLYMDDMSTPLGTGCSGADGSNWGGFRIVAPAQSAEFRFDYIRVFSSDPDV